MIKRVLYLMCLLATGVLSIAYLQSRNLSILELALSGWQIVTIPLHWSSQRALRLVPLAFLALSISMVLHSIFHISLSH